MSLLLDLSEMAISSQRNKREKRQIKCELCEIQLKRSDIRLLYDTGKSF